MNDVVETPLSEKAGYVANHKVRINVADDKVVRRKFYQLLPPLFDEYTTHLGNQHDVLVSLQQRHLLTIPKPDKRMLQKLRRYCSILGNKLRAKKILPLTLSEAHTMLRKIKGKVYDQAYESLNNDPLTTQDAAIRAFVKIEKWKQEIFDIKAPRLIQPRTPRFNLEFARYIKPIEHVIYNFKGFHHDGTRKVTKGLNLYETARLLKNKWNKLRQPCAIQLDCTSFDGHVGPELLKSEHLVYRRAYNDNQDLKKMCQMQVNNKCRTNNGIHWKSHGGRMSGDMNTGLGNSMLSLLMVSMSTKCDFVCDGDDCVVFCEKEILKETIASLRETYTKLGHVLKIGVSNNLSDVKYCSKNVLQFGERVVMCRDLFKMVDSMFSDSKHYGNRGWLSIMRNIAEAEYHVNRNHPIMGPYLWHIKGTLGRVPMSKFDPMPYEDWVVEKSMTPIVRDNNLCEITGLGYVDQMELLEALIERFDRQVFNDGIRVIGSRN